MSTRSCPALMSLGRCQIHKLKLAAHCNRSWLEPVPGRPQYVPVPLQNNNLPSNQVDERRVQYGLILCRIGLMLHLLSILSALVLGFFRFLRNLFLENSALLQQLAVLNRRHPRPRLALTEKLFWMMLFSSTSAAAKCYTERCAGIWARCSASWPSRRNVGLRTGIFWPTMFT